MCNDPVKLDHKSLLVTLGRPARCWGLAKLHRHDVYSIVLDEDLGARDPNVPYLALRDTAVQFLRRIDAEADHDHLSVIPL